MYVRNWMTSRVIVVAPGEKARKALDLMEARHIRRLPVVEAGSLVGIVTKSDLQGGLQGRNAASFGRKTVAHFMTPGPQTVSPGDTLESVAQLMMRKRISGVPVVAVEKLVGILTESDLFRALYRMMGFGEEGPRISMRIPESGDVLDAVRHRIGRLKVQSIAGFHDPAAHHWDVVVRVRGRIPERTPRTKAR